MIFVESKNKQKKILDFVKAYRGVQQEMETEDTFVYSIVPIAIALKYNVVHNEFLLHKSLLKTRKFYEPVYFIKDKKDLAQVIASLLETELSCEANESTLSTDIIKKLAKAHTKLSKTRKTATDDPK